MKKQGLSTAAFKIMDSCCCAELNRLAHDIEDMMKSGHCDVEKLVRTQELHSRLEMALREFTETYQ